MTTLPEPVALQFWSHEPITPEIREQLETILSGHGEQLPECKNVDPLPAQTSSENPNIKQTPQGIWVLA